MSAIEKLESLGLRASECVLITDSGHGWLAVKKEVLKSLGIEEKVTVYSYDDGSLVYLEEDCDISILIEAVKSFLNDDEGATNFFRSINHHNYDGYCFVRSLDSYQA